MPVISTDQVFSDQSYAVDYDATPQTIIVKDDVLVYLYNSSSAAAVYDDAAYDQATLINYGHIIGDGEASGVLLAGDYCRVRNAAGGDISSSSQSAVVFNGVFGQLQNEGHISSESYAARFQDGGRLTNSGVMDGSIDAAADNSYFILSNTGTINGAIFVRTGQFAYVDNAGIINGRIDLSSSTGSAFTAVTNSGTITGAILAGEAIDSVDNRGGRIDGEIVLGGGADTLDNRGGHISGIVYGGAGDDTFIIDATPISIVERLNGGTDTLAAATISLDLTKYDGIENVTLLGGLSLNATGDEGANVLTGNAARNTLAGGFGDDTYYVQNTGDKVVEANKAGYDTVHSTVSFSLARQYIEHLILDGSEAINAAGNGRNNLLTGNGAANVLTGGAGADTLDGGGGIDTASYATAKSAVTANLTTGGTAGDALGDRYVSIENLIGSRHADHLTGDGGENIFIGGAGADTLDGGEGVQVFDTASYANATSAVQANGQTGGTGGDAAGDVYVSIERLVGSNFNDYLTGGDADIFYFDGGAGADTMAGGDGRDIYTVDNLGDVIIEAQDGEFDDGDRVDSFISFTLEGRNINDLSLLGTDAINATGNAGNNNLSGNSAANVFEGGAGSDSMFGRGGGDTFVFHAGFGEDFIVGLVTGPAAGHDVIQIDKDLFADFDAVMASTTSELGVFTVIRYDADNAIYLFETPQASLTADNFLFV